MTQPLLDESTLRSLQALSREGEESFLVGLISIYVQNGTEILEELEGAVSNTKAQTVTHLAHKLKGMSLNLGATSVFAISEKMEALASKGKSDTVKALLPSLNEAFDQTCEELQRNWTATVSHSDH